MPNKTIVRTSTEEKADGTVATFTERIEEQEDSGLFEAWLGLVLLAFTLLLFLGAFRVVSSLINNIESNSNGIRQIKQLEQ